MVFGTDKVQPWNDVFNVVQATADPEKGSDNKNNNNETSVVNEDMERRMRAKEAEINAAVSTVYHVEIVEIHWRAWDNNK